MTGNPVTSVKTPDASDCRRCGACCIAEGGRAEGTAQSSGWADCTVVDVARLSREVQAKLAPVTHGPLRTRAVAATPTRQTREFGSICAFLRGTPGRRVSCRIYANRPEICRRFEPGSEDCRSARERIGLGLATNEAS
jgi:Fe-S-cluster containining protein